MQPFLLHPAAVHFPIVLLLTGLVAFTIRTLTPRAAWLGPASRWLLWLGTASAWIAVGFGLLAERTAPHVPAAYRVLDEHKDLGLWTAGVFTAVVLLDRFMPRRWRWVVLLGWVVAAGLLVATADHGGDLVYHFGMAVARAE